MKNYFYLSIVFFALAINKLNAQCDPSVPLYVIDLSSNADTTWVLYEGDALNRNGQCCSATSSENCIQFQITLNANAAGVFFDYDGAGAFGSLNWKIDCGPANNLKDTICISGGGTFTLTFCKPGTDNGNYTLISVAKPTFPEDQFVPLNCSQPVVAQGVTANSIVWQSVSPGAPGDYDYLMSCTTCMDPVYTPDPNGPTEVQYEVCGYPILDYCVGNFDFCDTVKFTTQDSVLIDVTPSNPSFCSGGSVDLTASATGGDGIYNYIWYNSSLQEIGTGAVLNVTTPGSYTCEVRDGNYQVGYCDNFSKTVTVIETLPPFVNAGADQVLCADEPTANVVGTINYATGGVWSGGNGVYAPSNTSLAMSYTPTQAEIANGSVTLTLTSSGAGSSCVDNSDDIQLFFVDTIQTDLSDLVLNCFGSETTLNPSVSGGLAPLTYSWSNGMSTLNNDLGTGTHCLTITDANGCQTTECLTITAPAELVLTMSSTPITTDGGSDGTATATPAGGTLPYTYLWSNAGTNQTEIGLSYGAYTVTVTDAQGCVRSGSVVVNEPQCNTFSLNTSSTDVLCNGDSTGTATVATVNGTSPFTYAWNDDFSQATATAVNLPSGAYEITVVDAMGCIAIATAPVYEPTALINSMTQNNVSIQGGNDGSAQANITGGVGLYTYTWSTADVTSGISNLVADWYYLNVSDDNGCVLTDSVFINEPPCDQFQIYTSVVSPLCNGDLTGEASLSINNGVAPYAINWSSGQSNVMSVSGLAAGIHTVEVTDAQGCYTFLNFGISQPSPLSIALQPAMSTCTGSNNGTVDMTVVGGTYPYYYFNWDSGQNTEDIINLSPGLYNVTVVDENGCQATNGTSLTDPSPISVTYSVQHVTCYQGTDGAIDITPAGGTGGYTFEWSNNATTEDLSGIDVGGYILNVIDGNFCDFENPLTILVNEPSEVIADSILVSCPAPGATQAQVDVYPSGGNTDYSVSFDGGLNFLPYGNYTEMLTAGQNYDIQIKDVNACLSPLYSITIDPVVIIDSISFNVCYPLGQANEVVNVYAQGGSPDYSISYDNGATFDAAGVYTSSLTVNSSYSVIAEDSKSCQSLSYLITLPDMFTASALVASNYNGADVSCQGSTDGSIDATVSGGTINYIYAWDTNPSSGVFSSLEDPGSLGAGTYVLTVEDANGCIASTSVTLTEPALLTNTIAVTSDYNGENISCNGASDGSAEIIPTGGVSPYSFLWSDGQNTSVANGLNAGTYTVDVIDANGCATGNTISLTEPSALSFTTITDDVTCNGINDGAIDVTPTGGTTPYTYLWDHGAGTEDVAGLGIGTFGLTLTDANNCSFYNTAVISEPTVLVLDLAVINASCFNFDDGSLDLTVAGGTSPYTYLWSNAGETSEDLSNLPAGTYSVTVSDDNGCTANIGEEVSEPDSLTLSAILTDALCYGDSNGEVNITLQGGTTPYSYNWSNGATSEDLIGLTEGQYTVSIEDAQGCTQYGSYTLSDPDSLYIDLFSPLNDHDHHISLSGGSDGQIDASVFGGTSPYLYDWSPNGYAGEDLSNLSAGNYELIVTDNNGCVATASIILTEPMVLELPTAFSPNNDLSNDLYVIHGMEAYPDNIFMVFNRWGNKVFEKENYNNTWNGENSNGEILPDGVYFVILEINGGEIKENTYVHIKSF